MHVPDAPAPRPAAARGPSPRLALMLLVLINLFNYIDRQVLAAVEPEIRRDLLHDTSAEDKAPAEQPPTPEQRAVREQAKARMGLLATAFLISYMLIAPVFGFLAEYVSRWYLVGFGVVVWSLASGASGYDWGGGAEAAYWALLVTRCFVGVGEAAYGPVAPAMIADLFPVDRRGKVMAWFYLAIPVGGALGYAVGEVVKDVWGWRAAFFGVVPPGLLLGAVCFLLPDPPRGGHDPAAPGAAGHKAGLRDYLTLLRTPSYFLNTLGMTAMTFAIGGLAWWMPAYLDQREAAGLLGMGPRFTFGVITALAGFVGTLAGGALGDRLRGRFGGSYFLVSGAALLLGFPMVLGFVYAPFPLAWAFVFAAVFCLFFNTGPTNTILANVTHPGLRASGYGLNILIIHLFGDAISPPLMGWIAGGGRLDAAFVVVSVLMLVGGVVWLLGARHLERDTALAHTRR